VLVCTLRSLPPVGPPLLLDPASGPLLQRRQLRVTPPDVDPPLVCGRSVELGGFPVQLVGAGTRRGQPLRAADVLGDGQCGVVGGGEDVGDVSGPHGGELVEDLSGPPAPSIDAPIGTDERVPVAAGSSAATRSR
jgi:hypothetical protein